jgi:hypothetical protein
LARLQFRRPVRATSGDGGTVGLFNWLSAKLIIYAPAQELRCHFAKIGGDMKGES